MDVESGGADAYIYLTLAHLFSSFLTHSIGTGYLPSPLFIETIYIFSNDSTILKMQFQSQLLALLPFLAELTSAHPVTAVSFHPAVLLDMRGS